MLQAFKENFSSAWVMLSTPLFKIGDHDIALSSILTACFIFLVFIYISKRVENLLRVVLQRRQIDAGIVASIARITRYLVITLGIFFTLDSLGINLTALTAFGAVLMVGIGFGLQNIAQNFISGLIILLERPIKENDIVEVGGTTGRVHEIRVRSTIIHTRDDRTIIVPNSQFIAEQVLNDSFSGETIRLHVRVGVAYGSNVQLVKTVLENVAKKHEQVLDDPPPAVFFENFGDSSLDFDLRVWIRELWSQDLILSDLRYAIDQEFRENQIHIPFPQRDVHMKKDLA